MYMRERRPNTSRNSRDADTKDGIPGTSMPRLAVGASLGTHSGRPTEYLTTL
ncbi:hypothetical protein DPMN_167352 [Dreissena polymorpha]|uniref:Uncharacterized protein n=1 Tax=Dreissena polymorpha TaxID=45954 RepID=A0A9D4F3Q5_DREPO|nr:hypothetical protein DPMN_167352 [Dreissena polymorpha]